MDASSDSPSDDLVCLVDYYTEADAMARVTTSHDTLGYIPETKGLEDGKAWIGLSYLSTGSPYVAHAI